MSRSRLVAAVAAALKQQSGDHMPWSTNRYPTSMRQLPAAVRLKAIEIANALLAEDGDEGRAIRIGIAQAKRWARRQVRQSEPFDDMPP